MPRICDTVRSRTKFDHLLLEQSTEHVVGAAMLRCGEIATVENSVSACWLALDTHLAYQARQWLVSGGPIGRSCAVCGRHKRTSTESHFQTLNVRPNRAPLRAIWDLASVSGT